MWIAWVGLGMTQIGSTRYLKTSYPEFNMWVHRIAGSLSLVITGFFGIKAATTVGKFINNEHSYFVFPMLLTVLLAVGMGFYADYGMKENKWNTAEALANKRWHTYPAYATFAAGFGALTTGMHYYRISPKHYSDFPIEILQGLLFGGVIVAAELNH